MYLINANLNLIFSNKNHLMILINNNIKNEINNRKLLLVNKIKI